MDDYMENGRQAGALPSATGQPDHGKSVEVANNCMHIGSAPALLPQAGDARASVTAATAVKPGFFVSMRMP
jgi:hypothetical protein